MPIREKTVAMSHVPKIRIRRANRAPINIRGDYVLYWMIANRRLTWNFALQRAVDKALELGKPLVILEALRCDYPWASDRLHRFIIDGMTANARYLENRSALYYCYLEPEKGAGKGLLETLGAEACMVVTDEFPAFFLPRMVAAAANKLPVALEAVDSNGLLPLRAADQEFTAAFHFRRHLQKVLPGHLTRLPRTAPLDGIELPRLAGLSKKLLARWPDARPRLKGRDSALLSSLPIDHSVTRGFATGGSTAARRRLHRFLGEGLGRYAEERNQPELEVTSNLSAYLHFGHISAHEIFARLAEREGWSLGDQSHETRGNRSGWWRMSGGAEAFVDQLVTWRELGFNLCACRNDYDRYEALPDWARKTLENHADDPRPYLYALEEFEQGQTHDPLWNAAQMQLVREGRMHNYLRMLWGKKILEWSASPEAALAAMIELNDSYALDGRDPNSYSGISWCLGRFDRAWGPERPIFGKIRYMSSANTARKVSVKNYLRRYQAD